MAILKRKTAFTHKACLLMCVLPFNTDDCVAKTITANDILAVFQPAKLFSVKACVSIALYTAVHDALCTPEKLQKINGIMAENQELTNTLIGGASVLFVASMLSLPWRQHVSNVFSILTSMSVRMILKNVLPPGRLLSLLTVLSCFGVEHFVRNYLKPEQPRQNGKPSTQQPAYTYLVPFQPQQPPQQQQPQPEDNN